ncbi:hypothetical protein DPSP01_005114 [Paraphaeosphaeria sporulosa]|uniref:Uncharacterized protein n=1 Tax=Paraphaeosphaeria sporulosa TaxID=1460663 RepID=A0A177BWA1_9PLEO|nr:uncharacterized protein CC84DRAFT_1181168 [Paraphaeosphaeria sporulosa]OAF99692.1 hypothetical protein CC84DRAFT_1181168 [Paraphaeosphaeria sporulosa]
MRRIEKHGQRAVDTVSLTPPAGPYAAPHPGLGSGLVVVVLRSFMLMPEHVSRERPGGTLEEVSRAQPTMKGWGLLSRRRSKVEGEVDESPSFIRFVKELRCERGNQASGGVRSCLPPMATTRQMSLHSALYTCSHQQQRPPAACAAAQLQTPCEGISSKQSAETSSAVRSAPAGGNIDR